MGKVKDKFVLYKKQNYDNLKKHHLEEKTLFIDPTFPAVDAVIGTSSIPPNILWKRPSDLCATPRLFVDIETSRTVRPGELSCNWIVSACAVLAGVRELCNRVIPNYWEQEWPSNYCGLFRFQFWRYGVWTQVVVDDLLPTVDNVLLTTQAGAENEFWAPLVEKAYAKLHGSYDALREGHLSDALVDFTGGVSEVVDLQAEEYATNQDKRCALFEMLLKEISEHSIMCLTVVAPTISDIGTRTPLGLSKGHAYHVTAVKRVYLGETGLRSLFRGTEKVGMIRLRDPRDVGRRPSSTTEAGRQKALMLRLRDPREDGQTPSSLRKLKSPNLDNFKSYSPEVPQLPESNYSVTSTVSVPKLTTTVLQEPKVQKNGTKHRWAKQKSTKKKLIEEKKDETVSDKTLINGVNKPSSRLVMMVDKQTSTEAPESEGQFLYSAEALSRLLSSNVEWTKVKESERQRLGLTFNDKAEFWMPLEDVVSQFTELTICRLLNRNLFSYSGRRWHEAAFVDNWRVGVKGTKADRAGGGEETLLRNPQYICDILRPEEEMLVQLMQINETDSHENIAFLNLLIGFSIIKVEENRKTRLHKQWDHCPTVVKLDHKRKREVNYRGVLVCGRYIIVPNTYKAGDTAGYMLRIFSASNINVRELDNDLPRNMFSCSCISGEPEWVTVITIHKAEGLVRPPGRWTSKLNPYCVIISESTKVKTCVTEESDPVWNTSFVFYRKNVDKPLLIQVYTHNTVMLDVLIGECELPALITHSPTSLDISLIPHLQASSPAPSGTLHLTMLTEDNLMAV